MNKLSTKAEYGRTVSENVGTVEQHTYHLRTNMGVLGLGQTLDKLWIGMYCSQLKGLSQVASISACCFLVAAYQNDKTFQPSSLNTIEQYITNMGHSLDMEALS